MLPLGQIKKAGVFTLFKAKSDERRALFGGGYALKRYGSPEEGFTPS
jgi:hypothetical protein